MAYYASIQRKNKVRISVKRLYFYFVWVTWLQLKMNGLSHCSIRGKSKNQGSTSHLIDVTTARLQKCLSKLLHNRWQSQTCSHQTITHTSKGPVFIKQRCSFWAIPATVLWYLFREEWRYPTGSCANHSPRMCLHHHDSSSKASSISSLVALCPLSVIIAQAGFKLMILLLHFLGAGIRAVHSRVGFHCIF